MAEPVFKTSHSDSRLTVLITALTCITLFLLEFNAVALRTTVAWQQLPPCPADFPCHEFKLSKGEDIMGLQNQHLSALEPPAMEPTPPNSNVEDLIMDVTVSGGSVFRR